jgi:hypothetical protein
MTSTRSAETSAAKVRCPACGAKNQGGSVKCRICGQDLRGGVERPLTQPQPGSAQFRSARLSGVFLLAVGGVLLLAVLALLFGVVQGPQWLTDLRNRIPLISQQADDGWTALSEPEARWMAELPIDRERTEVPSPASPTGVAPAWVAGLGGTATVPDTELSITWTDVAPVPEDQQQVMLASTAEQWGAALGGRVERNDEASFAGLPARRVTITRVEQGDQAATVEALLVRRRDQLVVLASRSVYPDHPQFPRLVQDFTFL